MRIDSVEAMAIDIPLAKNFGGSTYAVLKRSTVVTRMRTDEGLVSEVYNGDNREHGGEIVRLIHEVLAPRAVGLSLFEGERIWERLFVLTHASRDHKILLEAIACVDWRARRWARASARCSVATGRACPSSPSAATTWRARPSPTSGGRWKPTARRGWPAASSRSAA